MLFLILMSIRDIKITTWGHNCYVILTLLCGIEHAIRQENHYVMQISLHGSKTTI